MLSKTITEEISNIFEKIVYIDCIGFMDVGF